MKKIVSMTFICCFLVLTTSCSKDDTGNNTSLNGTWRLTSYEIGFSADVNKDGAKNLNVLEEIDCDVNETLTFESNNQLTSEDSFNHVINISKSNLNNDYVFDVLCAEGYVSFAETLETEERSVLESSIVGNQLTRVFENAIEIYNEDFTEIIEFKNLKMGYTKL